MSAVGEDHLHELRLGTTCAEWPDLVWRAALNCRRCALSILILLLQCPHWVVRRVERVTFLDDRTVARGVTTDFFIPPAAPRYRTDDGAVLRLVPLSILRRKTLVNFGLQDGNGQSLSLVSMRQNQALTEQMVLALAEHVVRVPLTQDVCALAQAVASGTQEQMVTAWETARNADSSSNARRLLEHCAAGPLVERLANNFLLMVTVPEEGSPRRIVRYKYDEPLSLVYKSGGYDPIERAYVRQQRCLRPWAPQRLAAAVGWSSTIIRFPVPAAENGQSFHFEVEAPPGVVIAEASLVAGRPGDDDDTRPSWDHVGGGYPVVGLHVCDVPNGSLSRAQVGLRLSRAGWLTTTLIATALTTALLWTATLKLGGGDQAQAVATALLTVTAAVVVFVVQHQEHQMASRLVSWVRAAGAVGVVMLVVVAALLTFTEEAPTTWMRAAAGLATGCTGLIGIAWLKARPSSVSISPWEQGLTLNELPRKAGPATLDDARKTFGFDQPAIKVASSEGDHQARFHWNAQVEKDLCERLLQGLASRAR